ncbi:MAG: hypothetical protein JHC33_11690 [Ignisphaera sp.]|nr:hypothetical protein [Ignisphaera sp.]
MIQGKKKLVLTPETILEKLSTFDIYRKYFGEFKPNVVTCNWMRGDKNPSFIIGNKYQKFTHKDFSCDEWKGNCFAFVMQMFSCSFNDALKIIDRDFDLGIVNSSSTKEYERIVSEYKQPPPVSKREFFIQMKTRNFTHEELAYWNEYYQDIDDLRANNVYSIDTLYLNKQKFPLKDTELRFAYLYESYWKIYVPYTTNKRGKWLSNVPLTTAKGLENLRPDKNTLICKSLKDYMVCKKVYPYVCHIQNESTAALSDEVVEFIKNNSKEVFYGGDSDVPGKKASFDITESFGFRHINPPDDLLPVVKDFADWAKLEGLEVIKLHFIKKRLL